MKSNWLQFAAALRLDERYASVWLNEVLPAGPCWSVCQLICNRPTTYITPHLGTSPTVPTYMATLLICALLHISSSHLGRGSHAQPSTHCRRDVVENIDNFFFGILQLYRSQGWRNFTTLMMDGRNRYFSLRLFTSSWSTRSPESSSPPTGGSFFTRIESHLWQRSVRHQQQQRV